MWQIIYKHFYDLCKMYLKKLQKPTNLVLMVFPHQSPKLYLIPTLVGTFKEKIKQTWRILLSKFKTVKFSNNKT